jgi:hypothetical protein
VIRKIIGFCKKKVLNIVKFSKFYYLCKNFKAFISMKTQQITKKMLIILSLVSIFLTACSNYSFDLDSYLKDETNIYYVWPINLSKNESLNLAIAEKEIAKRIFNDVNQSIPKLLGYKTVFYNDNEKETIKGIKAAYAEEINEQGNLYIAEDGSFVRAYFQIGGDAIISIGGVAYNVEEMTANEIFQGEKIMIIGRQRTDKVRGTGSNIIYDNKIYLKNKVVVTDYIQDEDVYVFDFGERVSCCDPQDEKTRKQLRLNPKKEGVRSDSCMSDADCGDGICMNEVCVGGMNSAVSCVQNHGGQNCSNAFGIWGANCVTRNDVCMDFNGWGSDCVKGSKAYFLGSDCSKAMLLFHCWNEI